MKFKRGDRVEVGKNIYGYIKRNMKGIILRDNMLHPITYEEIAPVEMDEYIHGHNCGGMGKDGHCWFFNTTDLRPIKPTPKIVITTDGKTTLARMYEGKTVIKSAEAKCSQQDEFDFNLGAKIAFGRLMKGEK